MALIYQFLRVFARVARIAIRDHKPTTPWVEELACAVFHVVIGMDDEISQE